MSFSTALSALQAQTTALDVVSNNLANLNTVGYKANTIAFRDLVSQIGGSVQAGNGISGVSTTRQFGQGAVQATGGKLDAAIQGDGFFVLRDPSGASLLTRAGNFKLDVQGNLITQTGEFVQGWTAVKGVVDPNGPVGPIAIAAFTAQTPTATSKMTLNANLDASAAVGTTFATPVEVIDSLGVSHIATFTFKKTAANTWTYDAAIPGSDLATPTATPAPLGTGSLTFDTSGNLTAPAPGAGVNLTVGGLASGADPLTFTWNLYATNGQPQISQFAQTSSASGATQDGVKAGELQDLSMEDGGRIVAHYSSGTDVIIGQLALASVRNPESLVAVGGNNFRVGFDTTQPSIGTPDSGSRGRIAGGSLESSTVDIAREFTNLIVFQRGYQANSRVITTLDELSQETLNLKR